MNIVNIQTFLHIVRFGSISEAAKSLFVSQPTVSSRLKQLEEENSKLKHIVADQTLEIKALKYVVSKNF